MEQLMLGVRLLSLMPPFHVSFSPLSQMPQLVDEPGR